MKRKRIKALIELSSTVEQADEILIQEGLSCVREKIAFLKGMFDIALIGHCNRPYFSNGENVNLEYQLLLNAIILAKWEA